MLDPRFDDLLNTVIQEKGQGIYGFLEVIFSFLYRRTDFFYEMAPGENMGFFPTQAEAIVCGYFRKFQELHYKERVPKRNIDPKVIEKFINEEKEKRAKKAAPKPGPKESTVEIKEIKENNSSENISNASTKASTPSNYFEERMNPQYLYEYSDELYQSMKEAESVNAVTYDENFWTKTGLDQRKRNSFIHYMYLIHLRFSLLPETLFLAVNLFDRVILKVKLDTDHLQMAAVTCLFIASKYQEIYPPDARDFIGIIGKMYTVEQMLDMEVKILKILDYEVLTTSTLVFFEYLLDVKMLNKDENIYCLGSMFLECNLFNMDILHYSPRLQAAGCIYLAYQLTQSTTESTLRELSFFSGKAENDIRKFVSLFLFGFNHSIEPISKGAIVKKYCREEYNKVSFFLRNTNNK